MRRYWDFEGIGGFYALRVEIVLQELLATAASGAIFVADEQGMLLGYLAVVFVMSLEHRGLMGEIDEFFLLPAARSRGIGARLLATAEAALARRGCVRLQLQLGAANARQATSTAVATARAGYQLLDKPLRWPRRVRRSPRRSGRAAALRAGPYSAPCVNAQEFLSADRFRARAGSILAAIAVTALAAAAPGPTATAMRLRTPAARPETSSATPSITRRKCCGSPASVPGWRSPTSSPRRATTASC